MLTRLKIDGFKNLAEVDVYFGPFTCIAGPNGVGKSNLFDAIKFISELADKPFVEAARAIRGGDDVRSLFSDQKFGKISLHAEMLIPEEGYDDFGQPAKASATFLAYELELSLDVADGPLGGARIRLEKEQLNYISKGDSERALPFPHEVAWRNSVVKASARRTTFIQSENHPSRGLLVRLQSDRMQDDSKTKRGGGKATAFYAASLPRTVLSSAQNAEESRTAVLVRNEMRSWRQIQLEPSSLRATDDFESPTSVDSSGKHIPAALLRLANSSKNTPARVYTSLANSLVTLVENVREIRVDRDESRRALRFMMRDRAGLELPASSLSDGTMRFVALSVIELDPLEKGLICLEEPENGIHPQRVTSMLDLLYRIACDAFREVNADNPLRQVIISTHSVQVVKELDRDDVLFATSRKFKSTAGMLPGLRLLGLEGGWRHKHSGEAIADGEALAYLKGIPSFPAPVPHERSVSAKYQQQLSLPLNGMFEA